MKDPRFASGPTNDVITIEDCTTTLLFPFVTNQMGFDTGLAITNASEGSGSCTIEYSGPDAPDDTDDARGSRGWGTVGQFSVRDCPRIPGLYHCKLWISGCARLCLHHRPRGVTTWRRVISRCARIATTRKAHRVAALRVRK